MVTVLAIIGVVAILCLIIALIYWGISVHETLKEHERRIEHHFECIMDRIGKVEYNWLVKRVEKLEKKD